MEPEWMHLPQAHVIKNVYLKWLQQLMGGGEIEELHEVLNDFQAVWKGAWQLSLYVGNLL